MQRNRHDQMKAVHVKIGAKGIEQVMLKGTGQDKFRLIFEQSQGLLQNTLIHKGRPDAMQCRGCFKTGATQVIRPGFKAMAAGRAKRVIKYRQGMAHTLTAEADA